MKCPKRRFFSCPATRQLNVAATIWSSHGAAGADHEDRKTTAEPKRCADSERAHADTATKALHQTTKRLLNLDEAT